MLEAGSEALSWNFQAQAIVVPCRVLHKLQKGLNS